ncbi:MAG: sulfatase-like hydrolase/transferase [Cytophagales bacterium]|nr:sulfatase-like hydrolase/transferase [Cytophagales bacterium]
MNSALKKITAHRLQFVVLLALLLVLISTLTRIALVFKSGFDVGLTFLNVMGAFGLGLLFDLFNAAYFCIPVSIYLWLVPRSLYRKSWHRFVLYTLLFTCVSILVFNAAAEWLFWDEFNTRFNFIAVDYLVYTTEVIGNIRQSYPIGWILTAVFSVAIAITYFFKPASPVSATDFSFAKRTRYFGGYALVVVLIFFGVTSRQHHFSSNAYANELAGNGMYELFAAYRNNELNYDQFYKHTGNAKNFEVFRKLIKTRDAEFTDSTGIERTIRAAAPEKRLHVVLISVESFSADFMNLFGNQENITPFLDSLAPHSLAFTNLYATGTRTVRGLEALSIALPPTPGQSIVRRPENENLFSLATVFNAKGYRSKFIYGGYGYFDNMSYFFKNNGYQTIDRTALRTEEIDYENIWGVADENLFTLALRELDADTERQPVFAHIMTTSNHRPFTYPDGRIDIPSHTSRQGAVKYTDYAIGKFIREASTRPWFQSTLFVIVADHCASSAGKTELPVAKYHIPMLIYAPSYIQPGVMPRLMSQIDVAPTLLGLLNFSYTSKFFGYDIFQLEPGRERAFISTYQALGYLKGSNLAILSPRQKVEMFALDEKLNPYKKVNIDTLESEAVAWYQTASYAFKHKLLR